MKRLYTGLIMLLCICFSFESIAQYNPKNICRIEDNKAIFKLDRRWTEKQKKEVESLFDLDSLLLEAAFRGSKEINLDGVKWQIKIIDKNLVELVKDMNTNPAPHVSTRDIFIFEDLKNNLTNTKVQEAVAFGVNNFKQNNIFVYKNSVVRLFLPGELRAHKIYLSGSFNNWNTVQIPMHQIPSGWIVNIKLKPGKYLYKYIIDGNWTDDPNNKLRENDDNGGKNSIMYCPNYVFELKNHKSAHEVMLAGNFNNWKSNQLEMFPTPQGWALPVYLKDGTYSYKFIVDDKWITDPANKNTHSDGLGNINSYIGIGQIYKFQLNGYLKAKKVFVAGNFNEWNPNELTLVKTPQGWALDYILAPGNYEYKFFVDGDWISDPANPFHVGTTNFENSFLAFKTNKTFTLDKYPNAQKVILTGDFNNWKESSFEMAKKDGKWYFPIYLSPGKHIYKFIVDGKWILDPNNRLWESNTVGTNNSVISIEP